MREARRGVMASLVETRYARYRRTWRWSGGDRARGRAEDRLPMCDIPTFCVRMRFEAGNAQAARHLQRNRDVPGDRAHQAQMRAVRQRAPSPEGYPRGSPAPPPAISQPSGRKECSAPWRRIEARPGARDRQPHRPRQIHLGQALTGTNPDRLSEEKQRGITIELGFAQLGARQAPSGVVDVPGHGASCAR